VELLARGVDERRREALRSLERGDPLAAREHAQALLLEVPNSPAGLAILVDACEALWLDEEAVAALRKLCESAPWRGELWVRLADGLMRLGAPRAEVARVLENALEPDMDPAARRRALLTLADLDLAGGDAWRASRWLDALRFHAQEPDVALRRLELALMVGDRGGISSSIGGVGEPGTLDGRGALAVGRARWLFGEPTALDLLVRAYVLEATGASEALAAFLAKSRDVLEVKRVRDVLEASGRLDEPSFALALAMAEGREGDARRELARIARAGDASAARSLYDIALDRRDAEALAAAVDVLGVRAPREGVAVLEAHRALQDGREQDALTALDAVTGTSANGMAHGLRVRAYAAWLDDGGEDAFRRILGELRKAAAALDQLDLVGACEALAVEQRRPLRVAVVGEFNAGKSTFINALLGADVAPTGILPTTASLHWLSWAPDPFARIVTAEGTDRIVPHEGLKGALADLRAASLAVREVHICAPIERLRRIEVLDTPGFNAPDADHVVAASRAVHEAHVVLWILDGTQALKDSERRVLARIADVGTPVQVLVNKLDRIAEGGTADLMSHVKEGLATIGLGSMSDVVCFSARLALAGRMGDADAIRQSRWDDVEALLSSTIVNRSDALRARALRRKALGIARKLSELAEELEAAPTGQGDTRDVVSSASRLLNLDRTECERIVQRLEDAALRVRDDLRPLRVAGVRVDDVNASAYAEARLLVRMTGPMASTMVDVAGVDGALEPIVREAVASVLRGASASVRGMEELEGFPTWRVARACAMAAHDRLMAVHDQAADGAAVHPRWLRLRALHEAMA
jgi:GTP-binding protein EngB required for normal cell division